MKGQVTSLRARSFLEGREADTSIARIPPVARLAGEDGIVERVVLWAFIIRLAWCPFWFGGSAFVAWGINAVLFPGLAALYELSLLIRGERHPVAIWQIKVPAALFGVVVLWILIQNATWTPTWFHHPIWQMAADALDQPIEGSISVDRELTSLALLRLITAASVFWIALQLLPRRLAGRLAAVVRCDNRVCLCRLWSCCLCTNTGADSLV